jgi:hypothetical protein
MPTADYIARAAVAFDPPVHPGNAPVHGANATSAQITETNRQYAADLAEYTLYRTVNEELKKQVLAAVPVLFLAILSDDEMGFAEVPCAAMLAHLRATYGTITQAELEMNRTRLSAEWPPEDAIEDLWLRIREIQRFALAGNEPISDSTVLRLTLEVLEKTGVFLSATERWRELDEAAWTLPSFQLHFTRADKERRRKLTAQTAGYHGAHFATPTTGTPLAAARIASPPAPLIAAQFSVNVDGGTMMYYCWTHGLGRNANHTSPTCSNKAHGHQDTATVNHRMGGSNIIMGGGRPPRRTPPAAIVPAPAPTS